MSRVALNPFSTVKSLNFETVFTKYSNQIYRELLKHTSSYILDFEGTGVGRSNDYDCFEK